MFLIELLQEIDRNLFLFLNGFHSEFMDPVVLLLTNQIAWAPLFVFIIYSLIKKYQMTAIWYLIGIAMVVLLSDQFVSAFMKPFFSRLRPSHDADLSTLVHIVNGYKGGPYSFASSHAANSFGIALYLWIAIKKEVKWIWILFAWAFIFSYTRIYLGVHYPGDILVGAMVGSLFAIATDWTIRRIQNKEWLFRNKK